MITRNFIWNTKYYLCSLGINLKRFPTLTLENIKAFALDLLFRIKDINDAFYANCAYSFIEKHWKKIQKAILSYKWKEPYSSKDIPSIQKNKTHYDNLLIITTIFSSKPETYLLDDNGNIISLPIDKKHKLKDSSTILIEGENNVSYLYERSYVSSLKKKRLVDPLKALAVVHLKYLTTNYKKYVSFVFINKKNIESSNLYSGSGLSTVNINKHINQKIRVVTNAHISSLMSLVLLNNSLKRLRVSRPVRINTFRRF